MHSATARARHRRERREARGSAQASPRTRMSKSKAELVGTTVAQFHWRAVQAEHTCTREPQNNFRHTTVVHLLETGVEVNVIRGWLGHVNLATTTRYADINLRTKEGAIRKCGPPPGVGGPKARAPVWPNDETMLAWLASS